MPMTTVFHQNRRTECCRRPVPVHDEAGGPPAAPQVPGGTPREPGDRS
ncbi:hypothetical protein [Streptomyces sp. NPDC020362]